MVIVKVFVMADNTHDDVGFCCAGNRDFIAIFVLFMVFPFSYAIDSRFMQGVDFVFVFWLLFQNTFIKQEVFLVVFKQAVFWECSTQFTDQYLRYLKLYVRFSVATSL